MKKTSRIAAMIAALTLAAVMVAPSAMMSASAEDTSSIKITSDSAVSHTYEIYQVMTGKYDSQGKTFSELKWGADVTAYNATTVVPGADVSDADLDNISRLSDAGTLPPSLTLKSDGRKYANKSGVGNIEFTGLQEGYYIIKDVTDLTNADDANSAWIVQVAGTSTIAVKSAKPTVDKQVQDETTDAEQGADADGYGESADHAINESFNFKLIASIPADADLKEYSTYAIKFNDTMSSGVTYEKVESVVVKSGNNTETVSEYNAASNANGYKLDASTINAQGGGSFTLTIDDIKQILPESTIWGESEITVEVIYKAHLNEKAVVDDNSRENGTTNDTNYNSVFLNYSNNPDATGEGTTQPGGKTETDYVWVFTYEVDNTKYKINNDAGNELAGAEFRLYESDGTTEIGLIYDSVLKAYRPVKTGEAATVMTSSAADATKGQFNIKGLDAGTYKLKETKAPDGYNPISEAITITIGATHKEQTSSTVNLTLEGIGEGIENKPVDTKNSTLPSTGGIGTKLFVVGGGLAAAMAGVYLVSKKKAKDETAE
jgi:fimbrial isopeptide formation D2 family protein/LPXTG-motif cell wall-anchored protein